MNPDIDYKYKIGDLVVNVNDSTPWLYRIDKFLEHATSYQIREFNNNHYTDAPESWLRPANAADYFKHLNLWKRIEAHR
jgi:hypothetical protein